MSDWARLSAPDGSVPDDGPRHWRRYRYDFRTMAGLGLNAYRFGCDWGRLQRAPYAPLEREATFRYLEMLAELRGLGIEPWLTLFQNALPRWAAADGGWLNPETPHWFADYAARLADVTDGEVGHWLTIHEPQIYALSCYVWGTFPGGVWGRLDQARLALRRLLAGHRLAARALRRRLPGVKIGLSLPGGCFLPRRRWNPADWLAAWTAEWFLNRAGSRKFLFGAEGCDFLMLGIGNELPVGVFDTLSLGCGISASVVARMRNSGLSVPARRRRWRIRSWSRDGRLPVYLVGSIGGRDGRERLLELLDACASPGGRGTAAGFFYDPLLDQFDPDRGLGDGRGLLAVDFHGTDRKRQPRALAGTYADVARSGVLPRRRKEGEHA